MSGSRADGRRRSMGRSPTVSVSRMLWTASVTDRARWSEELLPREFVVGRRFDLDIMRDKNEKEVKEGQTLNLNLALPNSAFQLAGLYEMFINGNNVMTR